MHVPARLREFLTDGRLHARARWRTISLEKERKAFAGIGGKLLRQAVQGIHRHLPGDLIATFRETLGAIRVVEAQNGRLREMVGAAVLARPAFAVEKLVGRMLGVALDFGRASITRLHEQWDGSAAG